MFKRSFLAGAFLLLLPGCVWYRSQPLPQHIEKPRKNVVTLQYKTFDLVDCKRFLGRSIGKKIFKKGYQPLQLTLVNTSERSFDVALSNCTLSCSAPDLVARAVYRSTVGRVLGSLATAWMGAGVVAEAFSTVLSPVVWLGGIVGTVIHGVFSRNANRDASEDYQIKAFPEESLLLPGRSITGVVFVPMEDFSSDFSFVLRDSKNGECITLSNDVSSVCIKSAQ